MEQLIVSLSRAHRYLAYAEVWSAGDGVFGEGHALVNIAGQNCRRGLKDASTAAADRGTGSMSTSSVTCNGAR